MIEFTSHCPCILGRNNAMYFASVIGSHGNQWKVVVTHCVSVPDDRWASLLGHLQGLISLSLPSLVLGHNLSNCKPAHPALCPSSSSLLFFPLCNVSGHQTAPSTTIAQKMYDNITRYTHYLVLVKFWLHQLLLYPLDKYRTQLDLFHNKGGKSQINIRFLTTFVPGKIEEMQHWNYL